MTKKYAVPALVLSGDVVRETLGVLTAAPAELTADFKSISSGSVGFYL